MAPVGGRIAGVELQAQLHSGLLRGFVHPLPEVLEGVLGAPVRAREFRDLRRFPEQEPAVVVRMLLISANRVACIVVRCRRGVSSWCSTSRGCSRLVAELVSVPADGTPADGRRQLVGEDRPLGAGLLGEAAVAVGEEHDLLLDPAEVVLRPNFGSGLSATGSTPLSAVTPAKRGQRARSR